jgi:repressor LexA
METIFDRIKHFAETMHLSIRKLESIIGASNGVISNAIKNNTDINSKWLSRIADNFRQINLEWLITGKGEMLKTTVEKSMALIQRGSRIVTPLTKNKAQK